MNKISCDIVKDLIPLYVDDVCSEDSKKMVETHLSECDPCQRELNNLKADITIPKKEFENNNAEYRVLKNIATIWNRSKIKAFIKGIIIAALLASFVFAGFNWDVVSVPTNVIEITDVSQLEDGRIVYHTELIDGYALNTLKFDIDEEGNFYITPLRPLFKKKAEQPYGLLEKGYDTFSIEDQEMNRDADIKALYYGTPKDHILIWKKGMHLPDASEEIEKMFAEE